MGNTDQSRPTPLRPPPRVPSLMVAGYEIPLKEGEMLIGRGPECDVSILGTHVSRVHARVTNARGEVSVEDPGSRNGLFLNGRRLEEKAVLQEGDSLLIGTTELIFFYGSVDSVPPDARVVLDEQGVVVKEAAPSVSRKAKTMLRTDVIPDLSFEADETTSHGAAPPPRVRPSGVVAKNDDSAPPSKVPLSAPVPARSDLYRRVAPERRRAQTEPYVPDKPATPPPAPRDALDQVMDVVARMLARGDVDAARRTFANHLSKHIDAVFTGQKLAPATLKRSAELCVELLEQTGDPTWFEHLVELHTAAGAPMSPIVTDSVEEFLRTAGAESRTLFTGYQSLVRTLLGEVEIEHLEACERVLAVRLEPDDDQDGS